MMNLYKKTILIFFSAFTLLQFVSAQAPLVKKDKSYGGSRSDNAMSIMVVENGNYVIAGQTISNDGQVTGFHGGLGFQSDFWVIKINSKGKLLWQKTLGGVKSDDPFDLVRSADGGYIIAGETGSVDGDVSFNHGQNDFWIVKLNTAGTLEWEHTYGGIRSDEAHSIIATPDGGFLLAGKLTVPDGSNTDFWVIKIDSDGNMLWDKRYGNTFDDDAFSIAPTADGGFITAGKTQSIDGIHYNGLTDYMVVKADANGNMQWQKAYGGTFRDEAHTVYQTPDGGYVVGGFTESTDGQVENNHGRYDIWILKINGTGDIQWQNTLGGSDIDWTFDVIPATGGGIIVSGDVSSTDGNIKGNHGGSDMWVAKLSDSGKLLSSIAMGGSSSDGVRSIIPVGSGYIVAGYANSNDGDISQYLGGGDFWIVRLDNSAQASANFSADPSSQPVSNITLSARPNPAKNYMLVNMKGFNNKAFINVYDNTKRLVISEKTGNVKQYKLNVSRLKTGVYVLRVSDEDGNSGSLTWIKE